MKQRNYLKHRRKAFLSVFLAFVLCVLPGGGGIITHAADVQDEKQSVESMQEDSSNVDSSIEASENSIEVLEEAQSNESEEVADTIPPEMTTQDIQNDETTENDVPQATAEEVADPVPDKTPHLVFGSKDLADEDAFVLLMFGDGFTSEEQSKFYSESEKIADYIMETSPWDEFKDTVKIYALGVVSNESGAKADNAKNQEEADTDTRDTYFGSSFWSGGMQRLLTISGEGRQKANELTKTYLPAADFNVIIVNATTYGGSGGSTCVASLNNESLEMMLHELGHTTADLADEYFAGASYAREYANMTAESDPEKVRWKRFIGKNGVGVYEYDNGGDGWYRPHENCKMRFLGKQYEFCEVCKEQIRKTFCQKSKTTKLFFQPYADMFYESETGKDMKEYFILRCGTNEITGDQLGDALTLTYKDSEGNPVDGIPSKAGDYTIEASFAGNETYEACTQTAKYTIELPKLITLNVESKVYDGKPADLDYKVDYDGEYTVDAHYTGTVPYAAEITYQYDSDEAPIKPGRYTVTLSAKNADGAVISKQSKDYNISFKATTISNNDTGSYPGAMPYYNNKTIVFTGEGFTADEQDEFEAIAKQYAEYFRNREPYKEADLYFNYHTVEAVSNESGIGTDAKDTYFQLTYDENGKIVSKDGDVSTQGAMYIGNNVITSYYKATIVIVNDKNVKEGTTVTNKRFTVYATPDEKGMEFAANELVNYFTGDEEGYKPTTDAEKETQRTQFLKALYYTWYGTDYAPIMSQAYNEKFVENGKPIDMAPYFHMYVLGKEVPNVSYRMSYYTDEQGKMGKKLASAPSAAGKYFAMAEFVPANNAWTQAVELDGTTYKVPLSRGVTSYTIAPAAKASKVAVSKIKITGISKKIAAGKKISLKATVSPANATDKAVTWKSSNKKVATVNSKGVVTMKKNSGGKKVKITATAKDGSGVKATYTISSMKGKVKKVSISGAKKVKAGKSLKLKAKVTASKGANKKVKWTSSNTKYAKVTSSGKVKTYKAGKGKKVKITAKATDGSGKKKTVTIKIK